MTARNRIEMIVESLEHNMNSLLEETLEECVNEFRPMLNYVGCGFSCTIVNFDDVKLIVARKNNH